MTQPAISLHMALCRALRDTLLAAPVLADGNVVANRRRPMPATVARQIFVYLEDSQPTRGQIAGAPFDWRTRIRVECLARDDGPIDADTAADALAVQVYARVMADTTLANLALDVEPQAIACTGDEADTALAATQIMFTVWHVSAGNSIAATT